MSAQKTTVEFNDKVVRQFLLASVIWGAVGMLVGVLIAAQLNFWQLNFSTPWLTWSRIRPLHTNAVIFAFVGNMMFAGHLLLDAAPGQGAACERLPLPAAFLGMAGDHRRRGRSRCRSG